MTLTPQIVTLTPQIVTLAYLFIAEEHEDEEQDSLKQQVPQSRTTC